MANTIIQLKRSSANAVPQNGALAAAEPAYSYLSDKLFIGTSDGSGVIAIGGKYFVDQQNTILTIANLAFDAANTAMSSAMNYAYVNTATQAANTYAATVGAASNAYAVTVGAASNGWANTVGTSANAYAGAVGTAANAYSVTVGAASNGWANTVGTAANGYAAAVGTAANSYAVTVGAASNGWANTVGSAANAYAVTVGAASNGWANTVSAGANGHADAVGVAANTYANNTFLKLTGGTLNGDLNVSGNLIVTGNTTFINVSTFIVDDPLIYLAANNYTSDLLDIGFVGNYNNGACSTVHTGIFRDAVSKEYYVFDSYDKEPANNVIDPNGNNFTIAVLNATLKTSNVILNGANLWQWVNNAYSQANAAPGIANSYAVTVGAASNGWANTVGTSANAYAVTVGAASNGWANTVSAGANAHSDAVGVAANTYAATVGAASNAYTVTVGAASNAWTNTVFGYSNTYTQTVGAAANGWANTVGSAANTYADGVGAAANTNAANATYLSTGTVPSARISGSYTGITGVGTIAAGTWQGNKVEVGYGGTGMVSFTTNGVLYGNSSGALKVTGAGTDGQVLLSQGGVPTFSMLDGGVF
mgnify:FL=1